MKTVTNPNELIALYMGYKQTDDPTIYLHPKNGEEVHVSNLNYKLNWNELIEVVETLEKDPNVTVAIMRNSCLITQINPSDQMNARRYVSAIEEDKVTAVWVAIVKYITEGA